MLSAHPETGASLFAGCSGCLHKFIQNEYCEQTLSFVMQQSVKVISKKQALQIIMNKSQKIDNEKLGINTWLLVW
ncbi:hypothetical protein JYT30_00620 [Desulfotalea psychrophila]|nr:hypothetical protein [Desulfocapsa sp.]MBN4065329.1 hypothetical protein [Desulfocapsa sp. AH-315-G09]MBN4071645.1 hypothetical protein [Desulfotalea psychrophila]